MVCAGEIDFALRPIDGYSETSEEHAKAKRAMGKCLTLWNVLAQRPAYVVASSPMTLPDVALTTVPSTNVSPCVVIMGGVLYHACRSVRGTTAMEEEERASLSLPELVSHISKLQAPTIAVNVAAAAWRKVRSVQTHDRVQGFVDQLTGALTQESTLAR